MIENNNPLVSVIIPAYNSEKYIGPTIKSVIGQSYENFEILIIDDDSSDRTSMVIMDIAKSDKRIKYFKIEHSGKPAVPRNIGIINAKGIFIAFLDSDDIWAKDKLKEQVNFLQKHPQLIFVYSMSVTFGNVNIISPYYEVLPLFHKVTRNKKELISKGNSITCSSVLIRTEFLKIVGGYDEDPGLKAVEDFDLWLRLSELGDFGFIPRIHVFYRIHGTQSSGDWEMKRKRIQYLSVKRNINLRDYKFFRNKGIVLRIIRNLVHFFTYLIVRILSLICSRRL